MGFDDSYYRRVSDLVDQLRPGPPPTQRSRWNVARIKRIALQVALAVCVAVSGFYVGDGLVARYRLSRGRLLGQVSVGHLYAIKQKSGKTEFVDAGTEAETCAHSLFPQFGYPPCWYLSRHNERQTNL